MMATPCNSFGCARPHFDVTKDCDEAVIRTPEGAFSTFPVLLDLLRYVLGFEVPCPGTFCLDRVFVGMVRQMGILLEGSRRFNRATRA
jgi:hypothetical protein